MKWLTRVAQLGVAANSSSSALSVPVIGGDKCHHEAHSLVGAGRQAYAWAIKMQGSWKG